MTITYPISLPAGATFSRISWQGVEVVGAAMSPFTLQTQIQRHDGQVLAFEAEMPPMEREIAERMIAFKLSLKGRYGTFLFGDPKAATPLGTAPGTPVANSALSPTNNVTGSELFDTGGWTANQSNILLPGDWIQIGSGSSARLHKNLTAVNSDSGGYATLDIWPRLRADVTDATAITVANPKGVFRMRDNTMEWSVDAITDYGLTFAGVESF